MSSADFWDKRARQYDDAVRQHAAPYDKTIKRTSASLSDSDLVLDFGCGSGEYAVDLAPQVRHMHGIDTSAGMIDLAKQKAYDRRLENVRFEQTDLHDPGLDGRSFDAVLAFSVLHLVDDVSKTLARANELLAAGGLLITETPCLGDRGWLFRSFVRLAQILGLAPEIFRLSGDELESLVSRAGFEIVESTSWDERNALYWIVARKR